MSDSYLKTTYSPRSDNAYIYIQEDDWNYPVTTASFQIKGVLEFGVINVDLDKEKKILGFEILGASHIFPEPFIKKLKENASEE